MDDDKADSRGASPHDHVGDTTGPTLNDQPPPSPQSDLSSGHGSAYAKPVGAAVETVPVHSHSDDQAMASHSNSANVNTPEKSVGDGSRLATAQVILGGVFKTLDSLVATAESAVKNLERASSSNAEGRDVAMCNDGADRQTPLGEVGDLGEGNNTVSSNVPSSVSDVVSSSIAALSSCFYKFRRHQGALAELNQQAQEDLEEVKHKRKRQRILLSETYQQIEWITAKVIKETKASRCPQLDRIRSSLPPLEQFEAACANMDGWVAAADNAEEHQRNWLEYCIKAQSAAAQGVVKLKCDREMMEEKLRALKKRESDLLSRLQPLEKEMSRYGSYLDSVAPPSTSIPSGLPLSFPSDAANLPTPLRNIFSFFLGYKAVKGDKEIDIRLLPLSTTTADPLFEPYPTRVQISIDNKGQCSLPPPTYPKAAALFPLAIRFTYYGRLELVTVSCPISKLVGSDVTLLADLLCPNDDGLSSPNPLHHAVTSMKHLTQTSTPSSSPKTAKLSSTLSQLKTPQPMSSIPAPTNSSSKPAASVSTASEQTTTALDQTNDIEMVEVAPKIPPSTSTATSSLTAPMSQQLQSSKLGTSSGGGGSQTTTANTSNARGAGGGPVHRAVAARLHEMGGGRPYRWAQVLAGVVFSLPSAPVPSYKALLSSTPLRPAAVTAASVISNFRYRVGARSWASYIEEALKDKPSELPPPMVPIPPLLSLPQLCKFTSIRSATLAEFQASGCPSDPTYSISADRDVRLLILEATVQPDVVFTIHLILPLNDRTPRFFVRVKEFSGPRRRRLAVKSIDDCTPDERKMILNTLASSTTTKVASMTADPLKGSKGSASRPSTSIIAESTNMDRLDEVQEIDMNAEMLSNSNETLISSLMSNLLPAGDSISVVVKSLSSTPKGAEKSKEEGGAADGGRVLTHYVDAALQECQRAVNDEVPKSYGGRTNPVYGHSLVVLQIIALARRLEKWVCSEDRGGDGIGRSAPNLKNAPRLLLPPSCQNEGSTGSISGNAYAPGEGIPNIKQGRQQFGERSSGALMMEDEEEGCLSPTSAVLVGD